jgi:hypothetical protein
MPRRTPAAARAPARAAPPSPLPHDPLGVAVIVEPVARCEDPDAVDDAAIARAWADFESYLLAGLRDGWTPVTGLRRGEADILARGRLHLLTLTLDAVGRAHVCVTRRRDLGEGEATLALRTLEAAASVLFERLARRWPLRVRTGPYAAAPWRPERVGAAPGDDDGGGHGDRRRARRAV